MCGFTTEVAIAMVGKARDLARTGGISHNVIMPGSLVGVYGTELCESKRENTDRQHIITSSLILRESLRRLDTSNCTNFAGKSYVQCQ